MTLYDRMFYFAGTATIRPLSEIILKEIRLRMRDRKEEVRKEAKSRNSSFPVKLHWVVRPQTYNSANQV